MKLENWNGNRVAKELTIVIMSKMNIIVFNFSF